MAHFLYWIPRDGGMLSWDRLAAFGLGYAAEPGPTKQVNGTPGPGGGLGTLLIAGNCEGTIAYEPAKQVWAKAVGGPQSDLGKNDDVLPRDKGVWIGYAKDRIPGPLDLARKDPLVSTNPVQLGDDRGWKLPVVLWADGGCSLDKVRCFDAEGKLTTRVHHRHRALYAMAEKVLAIAKDGERVTDGEEWDIGVEALRTNYRISHDEISLLGLLSGTALKCIAWALVDWVHRPESGALEDGDAQH